MNNGLIVLVNRTIMGISWEYYGFCYCFTHITCCFFLGVLSLTFATLMWTSLVTFPWNAEYSRWRIPTTGEVYIYIYITYVYTLW